MDLFHQGVLRNPDIASFVLASNSSCFCDSIPFSFKTQYIYSSGYDWNLKRGVC